MPKFSEDMTFKEFVDEIASITRTIQKGAFYLMKWFMNKQRQRIMQDFQEVAEAIKHEIDSKEKTI